MKLGERVLCRIFDIIEELNLDDPKRKEIINLIRPFINKTEDIDLLIICKIEAMTGKKILTIPTKQEWRKIKLERLNKICNEKKF
jgi:hypothetical protein